jgi:hypothetical protein
MRKKRRIEVMPNMSILIRGIRLIHEVLDKQPFGGAAASTPDINKHNLTEKKF